MKIYDDLGFSVDDVDVQILIDDLQSRAEHKHLYYGAKEAKPFENQLRIIKTMYRHIKKDEPK